MNWFVILLLSFACVAPCQAQSDSVVASTAVRGSDYPRINPDLSVSFALKAPKAQRVQIELGGLFDMKRSADGTWTTTIPPQTPGFHSYALVIDGVRVNDPASETFFGGSRESSGIEIPEKGVEFYLPKDVPHGQVRTLNYHSKVTGKWRRSIVYTPPGYDKNQQEKYPVLYLLHGLGEDETAWIDKGHADFILDNLIAEHKAKPMIMVMENDYASPANSDAKIGPDVPADFETFATVMLTDVIPLIDTTFRTFPDREHRAVAGLSMGAGEALDLGMHNLGTFAYMGGFSGSLNAFNTEPLDPKTAFGGLFKDAAAFNAQVKLLWMGLGTLEPPPGATGFKNFCKMLSQAGIRYTFYSSPGTSHEWLTWRRDLNDFAPRLFQ